MGFLSGRTFAFQAPNGIYIWDLTTDTVTELVEGAKLGQITSRYAAEKNPIMSRSFIAVSSDGRLLAFPDRQDGVIWDRERHEVIMRISGAKKWPASEDETVRRVPYAGAFSPDGKVIAMAPNMEGIALRSVPSGEVLTTMAPPAHAMSFSPDGRWLAVSGRERTDVFGTETGELMRSFPKPTQQRTTPFVTWSADGISLITAESTETSYQGTFETLVAIRELAQLE